MKSPLVRGLKSVVFTSNKPDETARFYREVLSVPLEKEDHRGAKEHWACAFDGLHFAVHHADGFWLGDLPKDSRGERTYLAFTIEDLAAFLEHLKRQNVPVESEFEIGPMKFVTIRDPDGRPVSCGTPWTGG
jgi:catechol 2,3-dioxygenase-like lactoylglutathione lyase family enzyme